MRRFIIVGAVALMASLIAAPGFAADATTGRGLTSFFVAHQSSSEEGPQVTLIGKIKEGLPDHILMLHATLKVAPTPTSNCGSIDILSPRVNGVLMNPDALGGMISASTTCASTTSCPTLTATYWLGLDAAEVAHPGVFIGQRLRIELIGRLLGVAPFLHCSMFSTFTASAVMQPR